MESTQVDLSVTGTTDLHRRHKMARVPRSATAHSSVKSVPRLNKREGTAASAATQRVQISPPVCGTHPGKVLELRTSLGLARARAILEQQPLERSIAEVEPGPGQRGGASTRGQLKSARLQPLMGAIDPVLTPDSCLGIVPATVMRDPSNKNRKQRPRSSTVPGLHFDEHIPSRQRDGSRVKVKRRSFSALAARSIDTEKLLQLFSVSRSTGLVPQSLPESERAEAADHCPTRGQTLPPVVPHLQLGEPGIKVEVKGLKKASLHSPESTSPRLSPKKSSDAPSSPRDVKLPLITNSPGRKKLPSNSDKDTQDPKESPIDFKKRANSSSHNETSVKSATISDHTSVSDSNTSTSDGGIMRVSIVSLGEAEVAEERSRGRNQRRKRQPSGKQSGRLSLGWSPPQPIEPLKGNPLLISPTESKTTTPRKSQGKTRDVGSHGDENGTGPEDTGMGLELVRPISALSSRPMSAMSSNILSVNVSEFLQDIDTHVQY